MPSSLDSGVLKELNSYYYSILRGLPGADLNYGEEFLKALLFNGGLLLLVWFFGLTVLGFILVFPVIFYKGFALGFCISFILGQRAVEGIIILLFTVLPQSLIVTPILILGAVQAMGFSFQLIKKQEAPKSFGGQFMLYMYRFFLLALAMVFAAILQGFMAPHLLKAFFALL